VTRAEAYLRAKFHLDPWNRLAIYTNVTEKDSTDRQRSDSIGRTVLQTVAQKLTYYPNYCIHSYQIVYSDKDYQMPFVGGPDMRITNPRWWMDAILEKSKNRRISATV